MKKLYSYIFVIAMLLLTATSCSDVLNKENPSSYTEDAVFSDINLVKAYLGECYDRMGGNDNAGVLGCKEDLLADATDQLLCIHRPTNFANIKGTLTPDYTGFFSNTYYAGYIKWSDLYSTIQNVNHILNKIESVPVITTSEIALVGQIKGEAFFLRAFDYTNLLMNYGGEILHPEAWTLESDYFTATRSSLADTRDFILTDIDSCIYYLKDLSMDQGRATAAAAAALKSRLLLFCASDLVTKSKAPYGNDANADLITINESQATRLEAARQAALTVMNGTYGTFSLVGSTSDPVLPLSDDEVTALADNFHSIFNQSGTWNSETIWGIQYPSSGGNYNVQNLWSGPCGYHNWGNNNPVEMSVRQFEMADGSNFVWDAVDTGNDTLRQGTAAQLAADPLINPYNGREARFYASVLYDGAPWQDRTATGTNGYDPYNQVQTCAFYKYNSTTGKYAVTNGVDTRLGDVESWNGTKTAYYQRKFLNINTIGMNYNNTDTWVEFRYAEILLNYAEACIELGGSYLQSGLDALNQVRNRAGLPDRVTTDQTVARTYLRHERNIEFYAEGHRYYDVRRWMIFPSVLEDVCYMNISEYWDASGNLEKKIWKYDKKDLRDDRTWGGNQMYWLPIWTSEMNRAPENMVQNPGYTSVK